ncbi:Ankyrin repeat domain containing protein [Pandoravirus quercus]|uniref:Ankyrin repeat domain containing protein n=2 Tax=Pandoravirus TaxID=2060084 RepID=A0A2U7U8J2_9VIRU|nr:Ankyrin repeat domain containing protein [Pandoravirus quercus]AVK74761.1 Ankyrin repeat domain containing protein [Pandoravirus quercus]QBZ80938.1 ankyrin repeat incomplete domain containing protein [Pandoravirus celtis]
MGKGLIDRLYLHAKAGEWAVTLATLDADADLAKEAAVYRRCSSGWTFVHQAAFWGREDACRALFKRGASPSAVTDDGLSASAVARQRGHGELAAWLAAFADKTGATRPCSLAFNEAIEQRATAAFHVPYAGGMVHVRAGSRYFVDTCGCVLIGWHGSYNPPFGMDGIDLV